MTKHKKHKIIEDFLLSFTSNDTRSNYRSTLRKFFIVLEISNPNNYFKSNRDYDNDVKVFCQYLKDVAPNTFVSKLGAIKSFFIDNEIEFPIAFVTKFRQRTFGRSIRAIIDDIVPRKQEIKQIFQHTDVKGRALFLTLLSSGMRIGEALQLKIDDIEFDYKPTKDISITKITLKREYTKNKLPRITFITEEAKDALLEWLKIRESYIKRYETTAKNLGISDKPTNEERLFPYCRVTAWKDFSDMLKKSGNIDKSEGRYRLHIHSLRKYFRTNLATEMSVDMIETLMGHEGYLSSAYRKYDTRTLAVEYHNAQHALNVLSSGVSAKELEGIKVEMDFYKKQNEDIMKKQIETLKSLNERDRQFNDLQDIVEPYTEIIETLQDEIKKLKAKK